MFLDKEIIKQYSYNPEGLAEEFSKWYFTKKKITYPINPFEMLSTLNIPFVFRNLNKLEGILLIEEESSAKSLIAINAKRPIQRQRFSCAHELCHLIKDVGSYNPFSCIAQSSSKIERYAESFAACLLMPKQEVLQQINSTIKGNYLTFDEVLKIGEYFGTSFKACLYRIADCSPTALPFDFSNKEKKFKPLIRRKELGYSDTDLYSKILDFWPLAWSEPSNYNAIYSFKHKYIFNDSLLENIEVNVNEVAEKLTDLRFKLSNPHTENTKLLEIIGHSSLYDMVFKENKEKPINIYLTVTMNRILFSYMPYPEFGGRTRTQNTYVVGAKFETSDHKNIMTNLGELNKKIEFLETNYKVLTKSDILYKILEIHHELTIIHPFYDGNGRTARAFMNFQLLRYELPPVYIEAKDKKEYLDALENADITGNVSMLFSMIITRIFKSHAEFFSMNQ